jgi:hypothetical protein
MGWMMLEIPNRDKSFFPKMFFSNVKAKFSVHFNHGRCGWQMIGEPWWLFVGPLSIAVSFFSFFLVSAQIGTNWSAVNLSTAMSLRCNFANIHIHPQTYKTYTEIQRHKQTQIYRHKTHTERNTETYTNTERNTETYTNTEIQRHTQTQIYRHKTHTERNRNTEAHTNTKHTQK